MLIVFPCPEQNKYKIPKKGLNFGIRGDINLGVQTILLTDAPVLIHISVRVILK